MGPIRCMRERAAVYGQLPVQTIPLWTDTHGMPLGIAPIATILAVGAVALLAIGHAVAAWAAYEIELMNLKREARRLRDEFERRRHATLDAEAAHRAAA